MRTAFTRSLRGYTPVHTAPSPTAWAARSRFSEAAEASITHQSPEAPGLRVRSAQTTTASGADAAILAYCSESANFWSSALSSTTTKTHGWRFMAEGAAIAARSSSSTVSAPTGQSR